jgi:WD40 repeat protein
MKSKIFRAGAVIAMIYFVTLFTANVLSNDRLSMEKKTLEVKSVIGTDVSAERIARIQASQSQGRVTSLCFSPNAEILASGVTSWRISTRTWEYSIHLWNIATASEMQKFDGHEDIIQSLAFSPDGETLVSASHDKTVRLWDVKTGKQIRKFESAEDTDFYWVGFSADANTVGVGGIKNKKPTICLWDVTTGQQRNTVEADSGVILPDGQMLACQLTLTTIKVWEVHTNRDIMRYAGANWASLNCGVYAVFSADGNSLATVGIDHSRSGSANILRVWEVSTGKELCKVNGHMRDVSPVAFSPNGNTLACGTYGKGVVLRQTTTGNNILTLPPQEEYAECISFSPDGNLLAVGTYGFSTILIWHLSGR